MIKIIKSTRHRDLLAAEASVTSLSARLLKAEHLNKDILAESHKLKCDYSNTLGLLMRSENTVQELRAAEATLDELRADLSRMKEARDAAADKATMYARQAKDLSSRLAKFARPRGANGAFISK